MRFFRTTVQTLLIALFLGAFSFNTYAQDNADPIKTLMITGGGPWHDYYTQKKMLKDGLTDRIGNIDLTIDHEGGEKTDFKFSRHDDDDWAKEFDLVIYNQCNLFMEDGDHVEKIMSAHVENKVPAVMLHCPMHVYQNATPQWFDFTGAVSYYHEKNRTPFTVENAKPDHSIMANFPGPWHTPKGELYLVVELNENATPLARAYSDEAGTYTSVAWTHSYKGVRVFSSTLGHHNVTMGSDVNLNLIAAGLLWAAGKLKEDGRPESGYSGDRGLGWVSLWNGENLEGWRASETTDWGGMDWFGGEETWPTLQGEATESFKLTHNEVDHNTLVVDGTESYLYYKGRLSGGDFKNFEYRSDVYTYPNANSGIFFHTHYRDEGSPTSGYEADINTIAGDDSHTGGINPDGNLAESGNPGVHNFFDYYLKVDGKNITTKINGEKVADYKVEDEAGNGTIGLQALGAEGPVYFRNMFIRVWPD